MNGPYAEAPLSLRSDDNTLYCATIEDMDDDLDRLFMLTALQRFSAANEGGWVRVARHIWNGIGAAVGAGASRRHEAFMLNAGWIEMLPGHGGADWVPNQYRITEEGRQQRQALLRKIHIDYLRLPEDEDA